MTYDIQPLPAGPSISADAVVRDEHGYNAARNRKPDYQQQPAHRLRGSCWAANMLPQLVIFFPSPDPRQELAKSYRGQHERVVGESQVGRTDCRGGTRWVPKCVLGPHSRGVEERGSARCLDRQRKNVSVRSGRPTNDLSFGSSSRMVMIISLT